jgi:hypothetical protein
VGAVKIYIALTCGLGTVQIQFRFWIGANDSRLPWGLQEVSPSFTMVSYPHIILHRDVKTSNILPDADF